MWRKLCMENLQGIIRSLLLGRVKFGIIPIVGKIA